MSKAVKTIFGGTDDSAQKKQMQQTEATREEIKEISDVARQDALALAPLGQQTREAGFRGAFEALQSAFPVQQQQFQQGNVAGQMALLAGLPQVQNAIMGNQVSYQGLRPYIGQSTNPFANLQAPQFANMSDWASNRYMGIAEGTKPQAGQTATPATPSDQLSQNNEAGWMINPRNAGGR